ncbi:MAG: cadherin-like beta sandwich domain-containing protein [Eubacteriales bacterium]|nr:cadherin-like beta sandwich domain-containing protein [Eubacteriales bacterium]
MKKTNHAGKKILSLLLALTLLLGTIPAAAMEVKAENNQDVIVLEDAEDSIVVEETVEQDENPEPEELVGEPENDNIQNYLNTIDENIKHGLLYLNSLPCNAYGYEWTIFTILRCGGTISEENKTAYLNSLKDDLDADGQLSSNDQGQPTDYARVILTLGMLGENPSDFQGYNLVETLYNWNKLDNLTINQICWTLLALDSKQYGIPKDAKWSRETLINLLVRKQNEDGGFASWGSTSDVDMTAMVLQALVPYKDASRAEVQPVFEGGISYLQKQINEDAGFESWGNENSCSTAQVLILLSMLGMDPVGSDGFVKDPKNMITNLEGYRDETDGGFFWQKGSPYSKDGSTYQVVLALESCRRFANKQNSIYDLTDVVSSATNQEKVEALKEAYDKEYGALRPKCGTDSNIAEFVLQKIQGYTDINSDGVTISLKTTNNSNYILEDGTIQYKKDALDLYGNNTTNVSCTFLFSCGDAQVETNVRTVSIGWDYDYFNNKIEEEANQLTVESIQSENNNLNLSQVDSDFQLKQCMGTSLRQVWSVIDWSSSNENVISFEDTEYGSKLNPKKAVVHPQQEDTEVILTAIFKANENVLNSYLEKVDDFATVKKEFKVTVKGSGVVEPAEDELLSILNQYYTDDLLKTFGTDDPVDFKNCQNDIQLPRYTKIKDKDNKYVFQNKEISVTSDNTDVIQINGYRANVDIFQNSSVTVNLIVSFTRGGVTVCKKIPIQVGVITPEMLDAELEMMEKAKQYYFDGINDKQYTDKDSVTGNLHAFQEMILDESSNPVWVYRADGKTGEGIVPDSFFTNSSEMEVAGYNKFKSSNPSVVRHENLVVTRQETDTIVTISSLLSSEKYGKFAENHKDNEKLQKLYKQPVEISVTVKGTTLSPKDALEEKIKKLRNKANAIVEGDEPGQYAEGTQQELLKAIADAQEVYDNPDSTEEVYNRAVLALESAEQLADSKQNVASAEITIAAVIDTTDKKPDLILNPSVRADEAEKAGYTKPEELKNKVTVLDALVVLHKEMFGEEDFGKNPTNYLQVEESGWIKTLFGVKTTDIGFYVNHEAPSLTCNQCELKNQDTVCAFLYGDTTKYSDRYLFIEKEQDQIEAGDNLSLTVKSAGYMTTQAESGCEVTLKDPDGNQEKAITDENGAVLFQVQKAGIYTAEITNNPFTYSVTSGPIKIQVEKKNEDPPVGPSGPSGPSTPVLSAENTLSALSISQGTLTPAFDKNITSYSAQVESSVESITVTPVCADAKASVKVNGKVTASGQDSETIALKEGENQISVVVTAENGTEKTYTITVTRAKALSANAELEQLTISAGTLSPAFSADTKNYTAVVENAADSLAVNAKAEDGATVTVNGKATSEKVALKVGYNTIKIQVTAEDGKTTDTYTIKVTRVVPKNYKITISGKKYQVTNARSTKGTVAITGLSDKKAETLSVPNTVKIYGITYKVTSVGKNAFRELSKLKTVKVGDNVTTIGYGAFYKCPALKSVTLGKNVKSIGAHAFCRDEKLRTLTLNGTALTKVGEHVLYKAANLTIKAPSNKVKAYKKLFTNKGTKNFDVVKK